jgi:hypothetical protein
MGYVRSVPTHTKCHKISTIEHLLKETGFNPPLFLQYCMAPLSILVLGPSQPPLKWLLRLFHGG